MPNHVHLIVVPSHAARQSVANAHRRSRIKALAAHGMHDYARARTDISARLAEPEEARWLSLAPNAAVLVTDVLNVDPDGAPIQIAQTRFAAERIQLTVES